MLILTIENVNLEDGELFGGVKSKEGRNKLIPIHSKIRHIVEKHYSKDKKFLFDENGQKIPTHHFYNDWNDTMNSLKMKHIPHETRHTFATYLDRINANDVCKDRLMGHTSVGTRRKVYTNKEIEELREIIEKIEY